ncbi:uncharacterized protein LOC144167838 [Haemaphysalis longicornis]
MELQKKKRKTLRAQVSRLIGEAEKLLPLPMPSVEELEVLIERLLLVEAQLKDVNAAIEPLLADEDAEDEFTHAIEYSDKIVTCLARLKSRVKRSCNNNSGGGNPEQGSDAIRARAATAAKVKLPKLELLKFNGNRRNWQPFWEQFETAIHKNSDLAPSEKFNYLRAALIGDGAAAIAGLQPTSECYDDAIDILQQRFGNQAALIQDHIDSLMNLTPVSSPRNVRALRRMYDNVQAHLRGLKALGVGEESYCAMLYLGLLRALPSDLSLDYNRKVTSRNAEEVSSAGTSSSDTSSETSKKPVHLGMLSDLLNFLRIEVETLEKSIIERPDGTEILAVGVFGGESKERTFRRVLVTLRSRLNDKKIEIDALETPKICEHDLPSPDESILIKLDEIGLSVGDDLSGQSDRDVDLLLGSDHYWTAMTGRIHRLTESLTAVESVFGWAVQGRTGSRTSRMNCSQAIVLKATAPDLESSSLLRSFWELESVGVTDALDDDPPGEHVRRNFEASITQSNGRYEVALPWKADVRLADNKQVALNRMENVRKKLSKNKGLLEEYDQAIRFYQNSGIAERVDDEGSDEGAAKVLYYMPHQAVVRENSSSTKLRIVFDASSHCANSKFLNDSLESGPNLNPDLVALLLNFRTHPIALVADVEKAFLQIGVKEEDRDALRFLWYKDPPRPNEPIPEIETWRMTRLTFGTTASPFLLAATLQHHFQAMESAYPGTARTLRKSVYVDDLLTGAASEAEAKRLYAEANEIFMLAGMRLHKWGSNSAPLTGMFEENGGVERNLGQVANVLKVLGMTWKPKQDCLTFSPDQVVEFAQRGGDTKRFVLQTTARLYDPLGLLSPFVVRAKILFQEIWKRNLRWDDVLPEQLLKEWIAWCDELANLKEISVPRYYATELLGNVTHRALHIYADASTVAYGAVVYLLTIGDTGATTTTLLLAKGRVAPLKEVTLPRLELMAGLIAARLYKFSSASKVNRTTAWIFRFLHNLKSTEKRSGPLTATEIQAARTHWLRKAQQSAFSADLKCVTEGTKSPRDSPLRDFITFIDDEGVLRIKSRFHSANMTYDERSPVVLPKQHRYSALLAIDAHRQVLHAGVRDTVVQLPFQCYTGVRANGTSAE